MPTAAEPYMLSSVPSNHPDLVHLSTSEDEPEEALTPTMDRTAASQGIQSRDETYTKTATLRDSRPPPTDPTSNPQPSKARFFTMPSSDDSSDEGRQDGDREAGPSQTADASPADQSVAADVSPGAQQQGVGSTALPRKEQPSMFDVPPGFRKRSPDRNRPLRRTNTSGQALAQDAPAPGILRAATEVWRPPTPPNHLLQKASPEPSRPKKPLSRSNTSFFGKLRRTTSSAKVPEVGSANPLRDDRPLFDASKPISATNRRPSVSASRPPRSTPDTPHVSTPPSPGSISSAVSESQEDDSLKRVTTTGGQAHSRTGNGIPRAATFQTSIAWDTSGPAITGRRPTSDMMRRRSQSTEHIPRPIRKPNERPDADSQPPQELLPTFSQHASEGSGLKSRRMSKSMPSEFPVSSCELNDEYKSTKVFASRGKRLGKGATSEVTIMAVKGSKDELVAVKEFRGKDQGEDSADYIRKVKSEYTIAKSLHHPNIVKTIRLCTHAGRWNHVMEYCELGDVYHIVEKGLFKTHYKQQDRLCFFKQILRAVDYLHSHGIAHRDIKLENLLLTSQGTIKLTDFGVSEVFCGEHPGLRSSGGECGKNMGVVKRCTPGICGSLPYIAPEVLRREGDYDPRPLDIWSSAITYITMQYGGPPWHSAKKDQPNYARFIEGWDRWLAEHPDGVIRNEEGGWPKCGNLFASIDPPPLRRILLKMLHPDPERRVSVREVLAGGFFKGVECCSPESYEAKVCDGFDASKGMKGMARANVLPKHDHLPPREHRTPAFFKHRFDMGDGWNDGVKIRVI